MVAAGKLHVGMNVDQARVDIGFLSLADLIQTAYKVKRYQVSGPDWMSQQRFDILAKMPEGATKEQVPEMLQGLLADRFKLTFHKETREHSVYGLVVGKGGPKLKESATEPAPELKPEAGGNTVSFGGGQIRQSGNTVVVTGAGRPGTTKMTMADGKMKMDSTKVTMTAFCEMLSRFTDKPVVDMTELTGSYDVTLEISMAELQNVARSAGVAIPGMAPSGGGGGDAGRPGDAASDPSTSGSVFASVQALGLKLESRKAPVETIVVDKLEKLPTEN
jgi:uncharacterized protein (TIGR03435 family)